MLDDKLKALWTRISPPQKAAFFGCLLSGYLVHLYVFTNIIPNSDGLSRVFDPQQMTVSGRWFLHFASLFQRLHPDAGGHRPLLRALPRPGRRPGRLSAGHPQPCPSALSGALMAAFPAVGYTLLYLFTASAYCFAIFFGGPLRLPGQKGPVALAGRLSAPGLLHGHLSGLCDGGHRPVPAGHFPGDPGPVRLLLRHPCAWGCG